MPIITWGAVTAIAPELASKPTAMQDAILALVTRLIDVDVWGEFAQDGAAYLAAHFASTSNNTGIVASETLGPMSRTYSLPPGLDGALALSTYGANYMMLLKVAVGPAALVP